jgi:hypothetical protein
MTKWGRGMTKWGRIQLLDDEFTHLAIRQARHQVANLCAGQVVGHFGRDGLLGTAYGHLRRCRKWNDYRKAED